MAGVKSLWGVGAVTLALALGAWAQQQSGGYGQTGSDQGTAGQSEQAGRTEMTQRHGEFRLEKTSAALNKEIKNNQGEKLGTLEDFAIDVDHHRIAYAVIEVGGFLGIGEKYTAVPFDSFKLQDDQKQLVLNVDRDRLKNAPSFEKDNWPDMASREWAQKVFSHYGERPYWERGLRGEPVSPREPGTEQTPGHTGGAPGTVGGTGGQTGETPGMTGMAGRMERSTTGPMHIVRAEGQLMNTGVKNNKDEKIGDIQELLIDQRSGDVAFAVIKFDADKLNLQNKDQNHAAVPIGALNIKSTANLKERPNIVLNNPDRVKGHTFGSGNWPDLTNRQWATSTYRAFGQTPYWERSGRMGEMRPHEGMRGGSTGGTTGQ